MNSRAACAVRRLDIRCPSPEVIVSYELGFELHTDILPHGQRHGMLPREKLGAVNRLWRRRRVREANAIGQIGVEPYEKAMPCAAALDGPFQLALHIWVFNRRVVQCYPNLRFGQ